MSTLCRDCTENPDTCEKDPLECSKKSKVYFELYEETFTKIRGGAIKFTLKLKPHEVGSLMRIVAVQINDNGEMISETDVGYIEGKYADRISFKEMTD